MKINISVLGLYEYDSRLFDNLKLPNGVSKDILLPELLSECSDFTLIYPSFDYMKLAIGWWSEKELPIWESLQESTVLEYNPIENYDRYEDITRTVDAETTGQQSGSATRESEQSGNITESRTAFNSDTAKETNRADSSEHSSSSDSNQSSSGGTSSGTEVVSSHMHGNIGVTTAAQMIQGYRDISKFSVYDYIVNSFKNRFCVQIY